MPGKMIKRSKIQGIPALIESMFADFKTIGMTQVLPAMNQPFALTSGAGKFVLDSTAAINPLNETQPWRILVDVKDTAGGKGEVRIAIANPQQITTAGVPTKFPGAADALGARTMGQLGKAWAKPLSVVGDIFINRSIQNTEYDAGSTISYILSATNRGVGFFVWDEGSDAKPKFSYFFVQFPVDKDTGATLVTDNSPLFCVYACDNTTPGKFVISEVDVFRPSVNKPADADDTNSNAILNTKEQVAIAKGNKYLITFPNRLNTERYAYTEELDMFAYTSADVIAEESEIPIRPYGETTDRVYRAMKANGDDNTGMRIMMLISGGGI